MSWDARNVHVLNRGRKPTYFLQVFCFRGHIQVDNADGVSSPFIHLGGGLTVGPFVHVRKW